MKNMKYLNNLIKKINYYTTQFKKLTKNKNI